MTAERGGRFETAKASGVDVGHPDSGGLAQRVEPLDLDGLAFREFAVRDLKRWTEIACTIEFKVD